MSGWCHNLFDANVVSGYIKTPAGYEFICKGSVLEFIKDYGFNASEYLYMEDQHSHESFVDGNAIAYGVRFNIIFNDNIHRREIKQICKQLKLFLAERKWIKGYIDAQSEHDLVVKWGSTEIGVGENEAHEDY